MSISATLMMLAGLLLAALLIKPLAERFNLPLAAVLVATGFVGSEILVAVDIDTGVTHLSFHDLIIYVFLPLLVFESAFKVDATLLLRNLFAILFLAVPILLLSVFITAALVYAGIAHPDGFPWIAALLTGAILSATDASPLTSRFARLGVPKRLRILLEGEDLFNDATAIVTFSIFLYIALHPDEDITVADATIRFCVVFFGGALIGLLTGLGFLLLSRLFEDHVHQAIITTISAYSAFLFANEMLKVSGVMAVLVTGLIMGRVIHNDFQDERGTFVDEFWSFNVYVAEALMFLLMGVTITVAMFEERWLAMLIGIVAVLIARAIGVFGSAPLIRLIHGSEAIPMTYQKILFLGSLRGAVALALSLSLPTSLPYWWTIQSITFGVVLFTLFVQAPRVEYLLKRSAVAKQNQ